ncbi:hypothetical protein N7488_008861 [Penicillium malachiteum]|nr:hypothetical protein N7488_008861 [Penicillium malachiteum]
MIMYTDGGCRYNGEQDPTGAAAAVTITKDGRSLYWTKSLPPEPKLTSQRAEITGIILALRRVLVRSKKLRTSPYLDVTIHTDSKYAIGCMTTWIHKWRKNGCTNCHDRKVANKNIIRWASRLQKPRENLVT